MRWLPSITDDYAGDSQVPICFIRVIFMPSLYTVMLIYIPGKDCVPISIAFCTSLAHGNGSTQMANFVI
jgi:hypothetical protein